MPIGAPPVGIGDLALRERMISLTRPANALGWPALERAVIDAVDELCATGSIEDGTWVTLAADLSETQLIELNFLVGCYVMMAFALNSLGIAVPADLPHLPRRPATLGPRGDAAALLERARVAVSPGVGFGPGGEGFVRFSLVEPDDRAQRACEAIGKFLKG